MKPGDKVVYPMHGAGEVAGIEENEVGGVTKSYYVLKLPMGNMKLMLPVDKVDEIGLRPIIDESEVENLVEVLRGRSDNVQGSWNKRFHANLDRMKTGNILDVAAVARNLTRQHLHKKISGGERRLLELSRQILISELVFVMNKTPEEISEWVDAQIEKNNPVVPKENSEPELDDEV